MCVCVCLCTYSVRETLRTIRLQQERKTDLVPFVAIVMLVCLQIPHEETPAKKLRLSKPSKSAALHVDLCKATNSTDALQYLLQFARKPVEAESVEGVVRILLEHYYKARNCEW